MTIKPILFNTEMVRAIWDGRKSCTRRICKDGNDYIVPDMDFYDKDKRTYAIHNYADQEHTDKLSTAERSCPICPDDILYVREAWFNDGSRYMYRANYSDSEKFYRNGKEVKIKWNPSIHMPKEAARIWLKVTDVRVERLQDITEAQAKEEGAKRCYEQINTIENEPVTYLADDDMGYYVLGFKKIWNSTIKKVDLNRYGWDANPWVWAIEFERFEEDDRQVPFNRPNSR